MWSERPPINVLPFGCSLGLRISSSHTSYPTRWCVFLCFCFLLSLRSFCSFLFNFIFPFPISNLTFILIPFIALLKFLSLCSVSASISGFRVVPCVIHIYINLHRRISASASVELSSPGVGYPDARCCRRLISAVTFPTVDLISPSLLYIFIGFHLLIGP